MSENAKQKATAAVIAHRGAILQALASHIGEPHAIGMGEIN